MWIGAGAEQAIVKRVVEPVDGAQISLPDSLGMVVMDRFEFRQQMRRRRQRDPLGRVRVPMWAQWLSLPFGFVIYLTENTTLALAAFTVPAFLGLMYQGPGFAVTQSLVTPKMRATAAVVPFPKPFRMTRETSALD